MSIKKNEFQTLIERAIELKLGAVDKLIKEVIDPLSDIGSPETLIGKPYDQWQPQDLQMLSKIYGVGNETVLARLIFNKEYEKVKNLEAETGVLNG